jgi:hypothetical protein
MLATEPDLLANRVLESPRPVAMISTIPALTDHANGHLHWKVPDAHFTQTRPSPALVKMAVVIPCARRHNTPQMAPSLV